VQVNLHQESQKAGVAPLHQAELLHDLEACNALQLRGLMVIPAVSVEPADAFNELAQLFAAQRVRLDGAARQGWDTLSMGMSGDYHAAISAGSTMVRIGTAIFGPRLQTRPQTQE
jgi:pyridoxal phosphate enzyme (YggS family)